MKHQGDTLAMPPIFSNACLKIVGIPKEKITINQWRGALVALVSDKPMFCFMFSNYSD